MLYHGKKTQSHLSQVGLRCLSDVADTLGKSSEKCSISGCDGGLNAWNLQVFALLGVKIFRKRQWLDVSHATEGFSG